MNFQVRRLYLTSTNLAVAAYAENPPSPELDSAQLDSLTGGQSHRRSVRAAIAAGEADIEYMRILDS